MEVFWLVRTSDKEFEELLESSFGGIEAEKVKGMVEQIAFYEYETDNLTKPAAQTPLSERRIDVPSRFSSLFHSN